MLRLTVFFYASLHSSRTAYKAVSSNRTHPNYIPANQAMPSRIAVIGGGISGLAAFWALESKAREARLEAEDHIYEVHLFEGSDYLGGHARSVPWRETGVLVDVGFCLFNNATYRETPCVLQMVEWS